MDLRSTPIACVAASLALLASTASAFGKSVLRIEAIASEAVEHTYDPLRQIGRDRQPLQFSTPDISLADFDRVEITVSAAEGTFWKLDPHLLLGNALTFSLANASDVLEPFQIPANQRWTFFDLLEARFSPDAELAGGTRLSQSSGSALILAQYQQIFDPLEFRRFQISFDFDPTGVADLPLSQWSSASLTFDYSSVDDPGAALTVVPVPEVKQLLLILCGLALLLANRSFASAGPKGNLPVSVCDKGSTL